jgi:protein-disulfide isomerase
MEEEKQVSSHESHHSSRKPLTEILRKNPWILSTIILGIFAVLLVIGSFGVIPTGNVISEDDAAQIILNFAEDQTGEQIGLDSVSEMSGIYEVNIIFQNQTIPLYLTKDGENLVQGLTPLNSIPSPSQANQQDAPIEVPKSDKPKVELFVMTHCPYGTQAEKGFIPTIKALGDKIDAQIRFVHYFMHDPEEAETPVQVCIRQEQSDKWLDYLECFLEDGDSDRCIDEVGIDADDLDDCVNSADSGIYYGTDSTLSQNYGVGGSPTLVINGVIASSGRSSDAFLKTICSAFNEAPEECSSLSLSTESPSPGFGYSVSGSDTQAQC